MTPHRLLQPFGGAPDHQLKDSAHSHSPLSPLNTSLAQSPATLPAPALIAASSHSAGSSSDFSRKRKLQLPDTLPRQPPCQFALASPPPSSIPALSSPSPSPSPLTEDPSTSCDVARSVLLDAVTATTAGTPTTTISTLLRATLPSFKASRGYTTMNSNAPGHESAQASVDAALLGPSNPQAENPPSRSQSPAKRLKSEEPPSTTVEHSLDVPDPMDEDAQLSPVEWNASINMLDATPETAGPVFSAEISAVLPNAEAARPATNLSSTPPPPEEQVQMVVHAKNSSMSEGHEWYLISMTWLKRFMAQVPGYITNISKDELEKDVGPIDNSSLVDITEREDLARKKSSDQAAEHITPDDFIPIRRDIEMGEDLEILPEDAWNQLVLWYGLAQGSPVIKRKVVNNAESKHDLASCQVELYPPTFTVYRLRNPSSPVTKETLLSEKQTKPKKVVVARSEGFQKFLRKVKGLAGVDAARKVRLWRVIGEVQNDQKAQKKAAKNPGAFKQMILDLQTFGNLEEQEKELIQIKDTSNDPNYNGSLKLGTAGLATGGTIVIEEQGSDGEWISEAPVKTANKFGELITITKHGFGKSATTAKKKLIASASSSRSSSPAPRSLPVARSAVGALTRGRERREGRPLGTCGLNNLGNTCYMNSALQCLRSVEELTKYFQTGEYQRELNPSNPLAHHGKVASAYAALLRTISSPTSPSSFAPREFKGTIGRFGPSFSGYQQQDSQEFLAFLLDGMHEDLNRIMKKPYVEKPDSTDEMVGDLEAISKLADTHWGIYKMRNDSAVADLFAGLYKSTLVCPECQKVSITFDPFMDLTLPLPIESLWSRDVYFFPKDNSKHKTIIQVPVELQKHASMTTLKEYIGNRLHIDPKKIMASEVFRNKFYKHYEDGASVAEMIQPNDLAYFYELDDVPTNWPGPKTQKRSMLIFNHEVYDEPDADSPETEMLLVPVFHKKRKMSSPYSSHDDTLSLFAVPFFIAVSRVEANDYGTIVEKIVEKYQLLTTHPFYEDAPGDREDTEEDSTEEIVQPVVELRDKADDEKDGFVEVSMKDAVSSVESEDAEIPDRSRGMPADVHNLFTLKISKKKEADRVPTGWSGLEADIDMLSRLRSSTNVSPMPQKHSAVSSLASAGNSGRRSPVSDMSDEDNDLYGNTEEQGEPTEDIMQDLSDDEEANYSNTEMLAIPTSDFYNSNSNASSTQAFKLASSYPSSPTPPNSDYGPLVRFGEAIIVEWTDQGYDAIFGSTSQDDDFRGAPTWKEIPVFDDPELARARLRRDEKKKRGIHLEDCLDEFAKEEVLSAEDPWYCPRCKEHRRATKKFELWKCPDILVIHLKRFSSSRSFRDKIDVQIECPIEGLDLEKRVGNTEDKGQIYDLIGVDNHYGGLGGGHYTAYVKNWFDRKWYYCDDASVRETDGSRVVTPAAYLLFYRRRSVKPLGGPHYERIITAANNKTDANHDSDPDDDRAEAEASSGPEHNASREPSPARDIFIGPVLPTVLGYAGSVGNSTLWGESMPLKSKGDELPSYEEAIKNTTFDFDDTSAGGVAVNESLDVEDSAANVVNLVPASDVEEDEKVEEVRVGDEEERL